MFNKNVTQGGQVLFYMVKLFIEVNKKIMKWTFYGSLLLMPLIILIRNNQSLYALKAGLYYYVSCVVRYVMPNRVIEVDLGKYQFKATAWQIMNDPEFIKSGDYLWHELITATISCLIIVFFFSLIFYFYVGKLGKKQSVDDYLKGRIVEKKPSKLAKLIKRKRLNSNLIIGGVPILKDSEFKHILAHGTTGVGKSRLFLSVIDQLKKNGYKKGDKVIIYDKGCSIIQSMFKKSDYVFNPKDDRCVDWNLWEECKTREDFDNFAAAVVPNTGNGDPFWVSASRTLFSNIGYEMRDKNPTIKEFVRNLLTVDIKVIRKLLEGTVAQSLTEERIEKTTMSVRSVLTTSAQTLIYLQGLDQPERKKLSIKKWMADFDDTGFLYLTCTENQRETIKPLLTALLSIAITNLLSQDISKGRRIWFFIDEISSLQHLPYLEQALAEGRKFGGCFFIGCQNMAQLESLYNEKGAKSIMDLLNTKYFFRSPSNLIATYVSNEIGKASYKVFNEQYSYGLDPVRDGVSYSKREQEKVLVTADEIKMLPDLTCYVTYPADLPVGLLRFKYIDYPHVCEGYIERLFDSSLKSVQKEIDSVEYLKKNIINETKPKPTANSDGNLREKSDEFNEELEPVINEPIENVSKSTSIDQHGESNHVYETHNNEENNINHSSQNRSPSIDIDF